MILISDDVYLPWVVLFTLSSCLIIIIAYFFSNDKGDQE